ncbi:hypothetical protein EYF80_046207 [Liparis tanakae]|uniref:Uncharacterized protein n=1 Tax=Liparis tanakae TaxID=230148 RepID=A0A4Z2FR01_9TELE|nr:hypothetical protein EYF80_046207 [Liparis tanakae]
MYTSCSFTLFGRPGGRNTCRISRELINTVTCTRDTDSGRFVVCNDATDDVVVFVVRPRTASSLCVVTLQRIRAVGLAGRLAHDLVDLDRSLMARQTSLPIDDFLP